MFDRTEVDHEAAVRELNRLTQVGTQLVLTNFVRAEAHALILNRLGRAIADRFLFGLATDTTGSLVRTTEADEARALDIIRRYADKDFSLTDAISFAVMERLGIDTALTFDRHFIQFGWTVRP